MNKSKRTLLVITVVMAVVLIGSWAFARGQWGKRGHSYAGSGPGCDLNLSPETEEKLRSERDRFHQETAEIRRQLHQRRLEFQLLWIDPTSDPEAIKSKQREMFELDRQFQEKRLEHRLAVRSLLPQEYVDRMHLALGSGTGHAPWAGKGRMSDPDSRRGRDFGKGYCW